MDIEILGCSGGIGAGFATSCYRVNGTLLLDAGSGLGRLPVAEMSRIRHVLLTHAHLDHICFLPLLADALIDQYQQQPLSVHALPEVLEQLQQHLFNWSIWPDFTRLPSKEKPVLQLHPLAPNQPLQLAGLEITPFQTEHTVPSCGYLLREAGQAFAYTGDTHVSTEVVNTLNQLPPLDALLMECAFPDQLAELASKSRHLTPGSVAALIHQLRFAPRQLWLTHFKPVQAEEIRQELTALSLPSKTTLVEAGQVFRL